MASLRKYSCEYFTATILEWKFLLANDRYKDVVVDSMRHAVKEKKVMIHAFVIMSNHMHIIWSVLHPYTRDKVHQTMLKFIAQTIIRDLRDDPEVLQQYYVGTSDRKYQVWERNPLSVPLWNEAVVKQKLEYLHNNPVRAGICAYPEDYRYSTATIYGGGEDVFGFVTPFMFGPA